MRKIIIIGKIAVAIFALFSFQAAAQNQAENETVGEMTYLEGNVDVHRDGELLNYSDVDVGLRIENYDLIETGADGTAEVEISSPSSRGTAVQIAENTAFYFALGGTEKKKETQFEMLMGSLTLKVQKLTGSGEVLVKTPTAAMGVRGTKFTVTAAPEGSLLITCSEGKVACKDKAGQEAQAFPGQVVEQAEGKKFKTYAVEPSRLDNFVKEWRETRQEIFKANALLFSKFYYTQYLKYRKLFYSAYSALTRYRSTFAKWADKAYHPSLGVAVKDRQTVSQAILKARSIFPLYEQIIYRLKVLARFHDQGIGTGDLESGYSSKRFFSEFGREKNQIALRLATIRYYFKLYRRMVRAVVAAGGAFDDEDPMLQDLFSGENPLLDADKPAPTNIDDF